ncbi:MAG: NDP-hexose 2,3-dehydratase family protein [Nitrospiraceae bacterium]|nr:NDP-hexose 2,3-dehydratase family protein [Nitrospiraceae bacterium]
MDNIQNLIEELRIILRQNGLLPADAVCPNEFGFDPDTSFDLFISRTIGFAVHSDEEVSSWIDMRRSEANLMTDVIPISSIEKWEVAPCSGNISHDSGRFFSIIGLSVRHRTASGDISWDQPIIEQPEVGILGILAARFSGVIHFCLQAKVEPGNINSMQLAPTVQATYSNYSQVHGGTLPLYIDRFLDPRPQRILFSKLQSEDGGRFLFKSNKNMVISVDPDEMGELPDNFIWLTLRQINSLMRRDNLINSCTRSVLSCLI